MADRTYIFEDFKVDPARRLLSRRSDGEVVTLTQKAFFVLLTLLENQGELVTKDEIMSTVWQDTFVEEGNLTQTISVLRKALGDSAGKHRFIVTESGKGYRFVAPVTELNGNGHSATPVEPPAAGVPDRPFSYHRILPVGLIAGVAAVFVIGYFALTRTTAVGTEPVSLPAVKAIAVLPFKGVDGGDDNNVLGIGMADSVIARLGRIKSITVRQAGNAVKTREATPEAVKIGTQINVDAVLEGSIQKAGDRIRVSVRLFRVNDGSLIWAENFDERETDIFSLQDAIAERVARSLSLQLSGDEREKLNRRETENLEAYHLYNKGRYFWNRRGGGDLLKSVEFYEQAIAKDPNYALAYAGIAESYVLLQKYSTASENDSFPKAKRAAEKALELNENLAEAHAALGLYEEQYAWNWRAAEEEFQKALTANPNYPTAHQWYGEFLAFQGRTDESIREIEKAFQLDPLSLSTNTARAFPYLAERRYQEVIDRLQPAFELDSDFPQALFYLARAYEGLGKYGKAIETYQRAVDASGGSTFFSSAMINSLVKNGEYQRAERLLNGIVKTDNTERLSRYVLARGMAALGKKEAALAALEQALETRDPLLVVLKVDPNFDALRGEDAYQKIIQKVGN